MQLRGNRAQKRGVMPCLVPSFCMRLAFSGMCEVMSKDSSLLLEVETLVWMWMNQVSFDGSISSASQNDSSPSYWAFHGGATSHPLDTNKPFPWTGHIHATSLHELYSVRLSAARSFPTSRIP